MSASTVTFRVDLLPPLNSRVAAALAQGQRIEAAFDARNAAENASAEELRELVKILADHIEAIGNARPARRPRHDEPFSPSAERARAKRAALSYASTVLRLLLTCRDLVDKPRSVGPVTLSRLVSMLHLRLEVDPEGLHLPELIQHRAERLAADPDLTGKLREALRPLALAELKKYGVGKKPYTKDDRRGFRADYRRKVADMVDARWPKLEITERDLKEVTVETSE